MSEVLGDTFRGVLVSDGHEADAWYAQQRKSVTHAECWAHTRCYFERAKEAEPQAADEALAIIWALYPHEAHIQDKALIGETKRNYRTQHS